MKPFTYIPGAVALLSMLLLPCPSLADMDDPLKLESMSVTAQKREENVQDVPMSIDVFSGMQLEDANVNNTSDLVRLSPNVFMKNNLGENVVVIRGISSFGTSMFSPAGYYVDDISYPLHYMHNAELYDVERVEILKGPQGTLYGRNSESGVINVITRKPGNEFMGKVYGEYGSYNTFRTGLNLSGPVVDNKLFLGVAAQYKVSDGYMENLSTNDDKAADLNHKNARATLRWQPSDRWDLSLVADMMDNDDHGTYRNLNGPHQTPPYKVRNDTDEYNKENGNGQNLRVKYKGDGFDFISITGLQHYSKEYVNDGDNWDNPADKREYQMEYEDRLFSQELRFSSPADSGPFEWLAGLYGFSEKTDTNFAYDMISSGFVWLNPVAEIDTTGYAAFGQATYTFFDKLHLTGGLRFDHQELDADSVDNTNMSSVSKNMEFNEILPMFSVSYDITDSAMAYTRVAKGFMAGGFNYGLSPIYPNITYDPEYTWNYEVGVKTSWLEDRLKVSLAVFYIDIEDKQSRELDTVNMVNIITNAASAHSKGLELEFQARPMRGLDIFGGFGYTDSQFDDFTTTEMISRTQVVQRDYSGNHLPFAPQYTYNLGAQYRNPIGIFARIDLFGTGKFYGDYANTAKQDAYQLVNLRLGYEGGHFDVMFWCKNLFDQEYLTYVMPVGPYDVGVDGPPRTIGVTLNYRF